MPLAQRRVPSLRADVAARAPRISEQAGSHVEKWSARRSLALIAAASVVLWVVLIAIVAAIV